MDVMVVGRRAEERWRLAGALDLAAGMAVGPEVAASRLAHPSGDAPDAVVLVVEDERDLAWLRGHTTRSVRHFVPVVAAVARPGLRAATRAAGAAAVVPVDVEPDQLVLDLRLAVADVTAPAVVITLDAVRTA